MARLSFRCLFLTLFFFAATCAAVFVGVGFAAAADTWSAFTNTDVCSGDLCDAYRDQASALYAVTSVAVVGTIADSALVTFYGTGFGLATGATIFTGLVLLNASFAFMGSLELFQQAHISSLTTSDWNESMYKAAIAFGVISAALFTVIGSLMACCTQRITTRSRDLALERLP